MTTPLQPSSPRTQVLREQLAPFIPRAVFLFSGHMIDAPDRPTPRFPPKKESCAAQRIEQALEHFDADPQDLALAQGANGGDLLFLEACHVRGLQLQLMLPLPEAEFITRSILPAPHGPAWLARYRDLKKSMAHAPLILPNDSAADGAGDPFEQCNQWLLQNAMAWGEDKVRFICLWDGGGGDGPGGTAHMVEEVRRHAGRVEWIDTRKL